MVAHMYTYSRNSTTVPFDLHESELVNYHSGNEAGKMRIFIMHSTAAEHRSCVWHAPRATCFVPGWTRTIEL